MGVGLTDSLSTLLLTNRPFAIEIIISAHFKTCTCRFQALAPRTGAPSQGYCATPGASACCTALLRAGRSTGSRVATSKLARHRRRRRQQLHRQQEEQRGACASSASATTRTQSSRGARAAVTLGSCTSSAEQRLLLTVRETAPFLGQLLKPGGTAQHAGITSPVPCSWGWQRRGGPR